MSVSWEARPCAKQQHEGEEEDPQNKDQDVKEDNARSEDLKCLFGAEAMSDQGTEIKPLEEETWFYKGLSGKEAERIILEPENKEGSFLIRESQSRKGNVDGLCQKLASPPLRKSQSISEMDGFEIPRRYVTLEGKPDVGHFTEGRMRLNCSNVRVLVKVQSVEEIPDKAFLREVSIRKALQHNQLVQLLAVITRSQPMLIITEFMSQGNLNSYLRSDLGRQLELVLLIDFAVQVLDGMLYMEENGYVHRDLRSANILLTGNLVCKIGDFSLAQKLKEQRYIVLQDEKVAVKWTAPEVFREEIHTTKSDIWSFGIFLMELVTFGQTPYPGLSFAQTVHFLESGLRMQRPVGCPEKLYHVMLMCWEEDPCSRPSFQLLRDLLQNL
ncbi:tyrosine-protein kinase HCK-like isoform X2 [Stegostoma tigrinum]|uniref:tyrosine-protein kinase HCK-like isoform X2 n=1 Tax=Stegostoma tigrinum TaxID=3053191 RepID=UPI0028709E28|nr:tyrosine-protein kinase HCK-like isoform X2 [Stegostoma tigrinum]